MEIDRVPTSSLVVGDVIALNDVHGWWEIIAATSLPDRGVALRLARVEDGETCERHVPPDLMIRRIDPSVVHHKDEFIGMTIDHARAWAGALGWVFRDHSRAGFYTDDLRNERIDVWTDDTGVVIRTEMG